MKELLKLAEFVQNYTDALTRGTEKFVAAIPILTKQHIDTLARRKLNSTYDNYMSKVSVKVSDYILYVELDKDDWLANAVETGVGAFDMKERLMRGKNVKISKKGFRYAHIPMGKTKDAKGGPSDKSQDFQARIKAALDRPKYGIKKLSTLPNGKVVESQQVLTEDPMLSGFYRTRSFDSIAEYHKSKGRTPYKHVLFRTMSENPNSRSQWQHPGIQPANIFRDTERWLDEIAPSLLTNFIENELQAVLSSMKGP